MANDIVKGLTAGILTARGLSIAAAVVVDLGLVWMLVLHVLLNPGVEATDVFWLRVLISYAAYSILQIWTLATVTGRGDDFAAAMDKFIALSPLVVVAVIEAFWLGARGGDALHWQHHVVGILWAVFAITDFFATDITNQRLRARQIGFGTQPT